MDDNKLILLNKIEYKINNSCHLCKNSKFNFGKSFGVCRKHRYEHLKHSEKDREMSIHICGICSDFEMIGSEVSYLDKFQQFLGR